MNPARFQSPQTFPPAVFLMLCITSRRLRPIFVICLSLIMNSRIEETQMMINSCLWLCGNAVFTRSQSICHSSASWRECIVGEGAEMEIDSYRVTLSITQLLQIQTKGWWMMAGRCVQLSLKKHTCSGFNPSCPRKLIVRFSVHPSRDHEHKWAGPQNGGQPLSSI